MAAALRLLLRCRESAAAPPSLALLQPLFPGQFSTVSLALALAPAPYLLRHYSSKPSKGSAPRRPTSRKGTPRQKQVKQNCSIVTYLETLVRKMLFLNGLLKDVLKRAEMSNEATEACVKASHIVDEGWDDRAIAMFENALDNHCKAFAAYEKGVDDFAKAVGSTNGLPVHILEQYQVCCKKMKDSNKTLRQSLEEMSGTFETQKMRKKINKAVGLVICLVLTVVIVMAYLT